MFIKSMSINSLTEWNWDILNIFTKLHQTFFPFELQINRSTLTGLWSNMCCTVCFVYLTAGWRWRSRCRCPWWRWCSRCRWCPPGISPVSGKPWDRLWTCTPPWSWSERWRCGSDWGSERKQTLSQQKHRQTTSAPLEMAAWTWEEETGADGDGVLDVLHLNTSQCCAASASSSTLTMRRERTAACCTGCCGAHGNTQTDWTHT